MDKSNGAVLRAKVTYFFKETFRAHSRAEYREIFSRGLNEDNAGVTGAFPWLYVRVFFALFILFTINVLVLRLTANTLYAPSITFLGGITFTVPFIILLYELYPKRDVSLFLILSSLVGCGTVAVVLTEFISSFLPSGNPWLNAVEAGFVEEISKAIPAIIIILIFKQKNPYACFLFAAAVGAGFSIIEDMGYIFYYSDRYVYYSGNVEATLAIFADRGLSSFCTHVLWTGAVGWAYSISKRPFRSVVLIVLTVSIALHVSWDLPLDGALKAIVIILCVAIAAVINITIVHKSRINTLAEEVDLTRLNENIIAKAKAMGERHRFKNAANLTLALSYALLSVIILLLCALPIGMEYTSVEFDNRESFLEFIEGGYDLKVDLTRKYDPNGRNAEERYIDGELTYVIQTEKFEGYDGLYYYGYYLNGNEGELDAVTVELDDYPSRIGCSEYEFGSVTVWAFDVNTNLLKDFQYNKNGTVTAVTDAEEFKGYTLLTALCATGCAVSAGCTLILVSFAIKLRRVKNEER